MPLRRLASYLIRRAERRVGVEFDYIHKIAQVDLGMLRRFSTIFRFLDPNKKVPRPAYHAARLRGAISADCGTCVMAEIRLALNAGVEAVLVDRVIASDYTNLPVEIAAVARMADAIINRREDDSEAREVVRRAYGDAGLIEIAFAMNGAALLPGIKRALGYATACDLDVVRRQVRRASEAVRLSRNS